MSLTRGARTSFIRRLRNSRRTQESAAPQRSPDVAIAGVVECGAHSQESHRNKDPIEGALPALIRPALVARRCGTKLGRDRFRRSADLQEPALLTVKRRNFQLSLSLHADDKNHALDGSLVLRPAFKACHWLVRRDKCQTSLTLAACGPFCPCCESNSTLSPSFKDPPSIALA